MDDLMQRVRNAKERAGFFLSQRRKDLDLYGLLADTLAICEHVDAEGLLDTFREQVAAAPANGRNRVYTESGSDVYLVVGRAVFEPEINRAASWRYSATLREAAKRGLHSDRLANWLRGNGGVNALFRARPVKARTARTKPLFLTSQIEVPKDEVFTLRLRRCANGFFDVIED